MCKKEEIMSGWFLPKRSSKSINPQNWLHVYEKINGRLHLRSIISWPIVSRLLYQRLLHFLLGAKLNNNLIEMKAMKWWRCVFELLFHARDERYAHWEETIFRLTAAKLKKNLASGTKKKLFSLLVTKWLELDLNLGLQVVSNGNLGIFAHIFCYASRVKRIFNVTLLQG